MDDTSSLDNALLFGTPISLAILIAVGLYGVFHRDRAMHFGKNLVHKPYRWGHATTDPAAEAADPSDDTLSVQATTDAVTSTNSPNQP